MHLHYLTYGFDDHFQLPAHPPASAFRLKGDKKQIDLEWSNSFIGINMVIDHTTASSGTRSVTRSVTRADLNAEIDAPGVSGDI